MADDLPIHRLRLSDDSKSDADTIVVYCSGSASNNGTSSATTAYACVFPEHSDFDRAEYIEDDEKPTNQRAILHAAIASLKIAEEIDPDAQLLVISNSNYLIDAMNDFIHKWKKNGWKKDKGAVKNKDLWMRLDAAADGRDITWRRYNEKVDTEVRYLNQAQRRAQQISKQAP